MTWENLTADADALRHELGFERWAVLGHSFGGHVALEYALRYPDSLSHLVLLDTGGDTRWALENAAEVLARRGYSPGRWSWPDASSTAGSRRTVHAPRPDAFGERVRPASQPVAAARATCIQGEWRSKMRPEALIFAGRHLLTGWTVMDRLGEITVPTLVMAGRDDFVFPPGAPGVHSRPASPTPGSGSSSAPATTRTRAARRGHGGSHGLPPRRPESRHEPWHP